MLLGAGVGAADGDVLKGVASRHSYSIYTTYILYVVLYIHIVLGVIYVWIMCSRVYSICWYAARAEYCLKCFWVNIKNEKVMSIIGFMYTSAMRPPPPVASSPARRATITAAAATDDNDDDDDTAVKGTCVRERESAPKNKYSTRRSNYNAITVLRYRRKLITSVVAQNTNTQTHSHTSQNVVDI